MGLRSQAHGAPCPTTLPAVRYSPTLTSPASDPSLAKWRHTCYIRQCTTFVVQPGGVRNSAGCFLCAHQGSSSWPPSPSSVTPSAGLMAHPHLLHQFSCPRSPLEPQGASSSLACFLLLVEGHLGGGPQRTLTMLATSSSLEEVPGKTRASPR